MKTFIFILVALIFPSLLGTISGATGKVKR
jgi:hypothetical protein